MFSSKYQNTSSIANRMSSGRYVVLVESLGDIDDELQAFVMLNSIASLTALSIERAVLLDGCTGGVYCGGN